MKKETFDIIFNLILLNLMVGILEFFFLKVGLYVKDASLIPIMIGGHILISIYAFFLS